MEGEGERGGVERRWRGRGKGEEYMYIPAES